MKILALLVIVAAGISYIVRGETGNFEQPFLGSATMPGGIALAFYNGLFSYSGWNYLNFVTEELRDPYKWVEYQIWGLEFWHFLLDFSRKRNWLKLSEVARSITVDRIMTLKLPGNYF